AGAHQSANAEWLAEHGAAVVVPDAELEPGRLTREVSALRGDERRAEVAAAALRMGQPDAASTVAAELLAMAEGGPLPSLAETAR
ncbi:MAG: hypothetical protein OEW24_05580, partial [Chloroflexota bacterium]|nr:hypothetical protein [Chloroflexota bacterium]